MSKRVTPSKRSKKRKPGRPRKPAHSPKHELVSRRSNAGRGGLAKVLAEAIDNDPFEVIGVASIATAQMQSNVGELFDELAEQDPRLGPTLWATVQALPFIDCFARPAPIPDGILPDWLVHIDDAEITTIMRRTENRRQDRSTYLVEVTLVPELVTTCVFELTHRSNSKIVGFWTVAAPIGEVADLYQEKYRMTSDQDYAPAPFTEACQNLLIALDQSMHARSASPANRPPWPLNLPIAAWVINQAIGQCPACDDQTYVAFRRCAGSESPKATELRRSLTMWPDITPTI